MNIQQRPLAFGRPTALLLSRTPTEYVNIRQRECPNKCCSGENEQQHQNQIPPPAPIPILPPAHAPILEQNGRKMESKLGTFPVDPIRDSYYGQSNSNDSALFAPYYFHENAATGSGQQSTTSNGEFEENERNDEGFHSNDSSTQSLLLWRRKQTTDFSNKSNGAIFRLEQNSRYSTPWWSSNENSPLTKNNLRLNLQRNSSVILTKTDQKSAQKCCLFPWLIGALLLLSICLLFLTVILILQQQIELQQKLMNTQEPYNRLQSENVQNQNDTSAQMAAMLNGSRIRENLEWIASKVHVAGTIEQLELMDKLAEKYNSFGFDVRKYEYSDVLLSMPDYDSPNTIHCWNERTLRWEQISTGIGGLPKNAKIDSKLREQLENDKRMHVWWNAYARNGTALGELVYVNYGTQEDFSMLEKANISVAGKIVLIRYGSIFRGDKVHLAERLGAIGVILYSDPFDYVPGNKTFPDDLWLPPSGSQRGTLYRGFGDPQPSFEGIRNLQAPRLSNRRKMTPFLPSLPYVHREFGEEELRSQGILPNIPATSIGYGDTQKIFARLDGPPVQWSQWAGSLPLIYRFSGSLLLRLDVNTQSRRGIIKNFIAKIEGREEPDRWILLGNHADAWTKGSIDPGTGTSIMLEMARVFGEYSKLSGWRPRRTIVFCQWDAEEFGLIGSTEWVEQNLGVLQSRAVAYINVDNLNGNTTLSIKAVPLLYRLIVDAAMRVPQPVHFELENGRRTLLDSWRFHNPRSILPGDRSVPYFQFPHSGSDFQPFISYAGIPVADLRMENVPYSYMLYHSAYEVPWMNERFLDPKGETAKAFAHFWMEIIRQLADNMIIPFNVEDYGIALAEYIAKMDAQMKLIGIVDALGKTFYEEKLKYLQNAVQKLQKIATKFQRIIQAVNGGEKLISLLLREQINNRLLALERCFLWQNGIREGHRGSAFRHILFSAPEEEQNSGTSLPIFLDPAARWHSKFKSNSSAERENELAKIRLAFGQLQFCVECAEEMLKGIESDE